MSRLTKVLKVTLGLLGILMVIVLVYLLSGVGDVSKVYKIYSNVSVDTTQGHTSNQRFLRTYAQGTGDTQIFQTLGLGQEDIEHIINPIINPPASPPPGGGGTGDWTECAKAVASTFKNSNGQFDYSQNAGSNSAISFNGRSCTTTHRDCSCLVSAIRCLMGVDSQWTHRTSSTFVVALNTQSNITTFADVKVGDVMWCSGHVGIVVKIDSDGKVYVADAGSTDAIQTTATNGYKYVFNPTDAITTGNHYTRVLR